jgi:hypothetical protein
MRAVAIIGSAICALGLAGAAPQHSDGATCHRITRVEFNTAYAQAKASPGVKTSTFRYIVRIGRPNGDTFDFFTRRTHRAYPAYIKRTLISDARGLSIKTVGYGAGDGAACDKWLAAFVAENAKIREQMKASQ